MASYPQLWSQYDYLSPIFIPFWSVYIQIFSRWCKRYVWWRHRFLIRDWNHENLISCINLFRFWTSEITLYENKFRTIMSRTKIIRTVRLVRKICVIINNESLFFSMILIWRFDKLRVSWDQKSFLTEFIFSQIREMYVKGQTRSNRHCLRGQSAFEISQETDPKIVLRNSKTS